MAAIDPDFLALLRCPVSRHELVQQGDWLVSTDSDTRLRYPIRDDIPVLLEEEAEKMSPEEWQLAISTGKSDD
jgi:uncharacterized protein